MTSTTIIRLFATTMFLALPQSIVGQTDPDSVQHTARCRLAEQVIQTGHPEPHTDWAWTYMERCAPAQRVLVYLAALERIRRSSDLQRIERAMVPVVWFRDGELLRAALSLAGDPDASVPTRVFAFMALARIKDPLAAPSYQGFTDGVEMNGMPIGRCSARSGHPTVPVLGRTPLPADFVEQITKLAGDVARDPTQPLDVRTAAACTG